MHFLNSPFTPLNTHILFESTVFFVLGIINAFYQQPLVWAYSGALFLAIFAARLYRNLSNATMLLLLASFIMGHLRYNQQYAFYHNFYQNHGETLCSIRGIITDICATEHIRSKQRILLHVCEKQHGTLLHTTDWVPVNTYIQLYLSKTTNYEVSDTIELNNITIKKPSSDSFFRYLIKEGISATIFCTNQTHHNILSRPRQSAMRWIAQTRHAVLQRIRHKMNPACFALFSSLFLGNRSVNKEYIDQQADQFKQWGISHHLARSGLHLTIFALVWLYMFRFLPFSLFLKKSLLLALSVIYYFFSWSSISFLRALYSFFLYSACNLLSVRSYFLHTLTLVTLFVLVCNPMQLFFLDFQLSFALTLGLAWISHIYQPERLQVN